MGYVSQMIAAAARTNTAVSTRKYSPPMGATFWMTGSIIVSEIEEQVNYHFEGLIIFEDNGWRIVILHYYR